MIDVRSIAVQVLRDADRRRRFVDEAIEAPRAALAPRDRALLTTLVFGATRHRLTLDWLADRRAKRVEEDLRPILRVALFQLLHTRIPAYAAVDAAVREARRLGAARARFVNAVLRATQREMERGLASLLPADPVERLSIEHSHPEWLVRRWLARFGDRAEAILRAGNAILPVTAQVRGKGPIEIDGDPAEHREFARLWVQDATAAAVAPVLDPRPGERIVDLCAAPGGKTMHLAELSNDGPIVALDLDAGRLAIARENARRLGFEGIRFVAGDATRAPLRGPFDAALVDAPCSNTGVLARRPDARWRLRPGDIRARVPLQRALVAAALALVRPGGRVVYSTCSIEREENEEIVPGGRLVLPTERAAGGYSALVIA